MNKTIKWEKFECEYWPYLIFEENNLYINDKKNEFRLKYNEILNIELWIKTRNFISWFYILYLYMSKKLLDHIMSNHYYSTWAWLLLLLIIIWLIIIIIKNSRGKLNWLIFQRKYLKIFLKNWEVKSLNYLNLSITEYFNFCNILEFKWIQYNIIKGWLLKFKQLWKYKAINVLSKKSILKKDEVIIYWNEKEDNSSANSPENHDLNIVKHNENIENTENNNVDNEYKKTGNPTKTKNLDLNISDQKIVKSIPKKKISKKSVLKYIIICCVILVFSLLSIYLIKNFRTWWDILKLYDKYWEASCELFDDSWNFDWNVYVKDNKILLKNLDGSIMYIDWNKWYERWRTIYEYFWWYKWCNFSDDMNMDYEWNIVDTRYILNSFFSWEDSFYEPWALKCKNKVYDAFDFELPNYCDFENEFSLSWWKEFKYRDLFSFKHPDWLVINNQKYVTLNTFFERTNVYVHVYDFEDFIIPMLSEHYNGNVMPLAALNEDWKRWYYQTLLTNIGNWYWVKTVNSPEFFDHISLYNTIWPIAVHKINVDWVNWLLINYYFTDDKSKWCVSQFVTELLLVKNYDEIISIVFKNNFWAVDYMLHWSWYYLDDYDYIYYDWQYCNEDNYRLTSDLEEFYKYWWNTVHSSFQENYEIINEIIRTIKINN